MRNAFLIRQREVNLPHRRHKSTRKDNHKVNLTRKQWEGTEWIHAKHGYGATSGYKARNFVISWRTTSRSGSLYTKDLVENLNFSLVNSWSSRSEWYFIENFPSFCRFSSIIASSTQWPLINRLVRNVSFKRKSDKFTAISPIRNKVTF